MDKGLILLQFILDSAIQLQRASMMLMQSRAQEREISNEEVDQVFAENESALTRAKAAAARAHAEGR